MKQILLPLFLLVLLQPHPTTAHNGAVAIAAPVEGIAVDGDLSDWPDVVKSYPISTLFIGDRLIDGDAKATFRIGFNAHENALYINIEVQDESVVFSDTSTSVGDPWSADDVCVLTIDLGHIGTPSKASEYKLRGNVLDIDNPDASAHDIRHAYGSSPNVYWHELRIGLEKGSPLRPGTSIGLGVNVHDRDTDGSDTFLKWGKMDTWLGLGGDVVLVEEQAQTGTLRVLTHWKGSTKGIKAALVETRSTAEEDLWVRVAADSIGSASLRLPGGDYRVSIQWPRADDPIVDANIEPGARKEVKLAISPPSGKRIDAGPGKGHWRNFNVKDGLASQDVICLFQAQNGDLWIGSPSGVTRYDGREFVLYNRTTGLGGDAVLAIYEDRVGHVWICTMNGGVSRFDGQRFAIFTETDGLASNNIAAIAEDRQGNLWFGGDNGVRRFDGELFTNPVDDSSSAGAREKAILNSFVSSIFRGRDGRLWFGTARGVVVYNGTEFISLTSEDGLVGDRVTAIHGGADGVVWIGTRDGLSRYDGTFTNFTSENGLPYNNVVSVLQDRQGFTWVGTQHGPFTEHVEGSLCRYDGRRFHCYSTVDGLAHDLVRAILEDREGHLWFGTGIWELGGGMSRFDGTQLETYTTTEGLAENAVRSIAEDRYGRLWLGHSWNLSRFDENQFTIFSEKDGLRGETYHAMLRESDGDLWLGTTLYDGETFRTHNYEDGLVSASPNDIVQDADGIVWITTWHSGLLRYDGVRFTTFDEAGDLGQGRRPLLSDHRGHLWIGTMYRGVFRYDGTTTINYTSADGLASGGIMALFEDRDGNVWLASSKGGVSRYDGTGFSTYDVDDGLGGNLVTAIAQDREGRLLFGTWGGGVSLYDGQVFQTLTSDDGLADDRVYDLYLSSKGDIWIGTQAGVTRYRPYRVPPPIRITDVIADRSYGPTPEIRLPTSQNHLMFEFSGSSLKTRIGRLEYVYRLVGHDDEWQTTRNERVVYTDLPEGEYQFQVKAVDRDLTYSEKPAVVRVEMFYQPLASSVQITDLDVQNVFSSFYKSYAERPIGSVQVMNEAPYAMEATLRFHMLDLMRRPFEQKLDLQPQSSRRIPLHVTLGEELLDLEDSKPIEAEVELVFQIKEQTYSVKKTKDIVVYGKGSLAWDDLGRAAAFVTPEDPAVTQFARGLLEEFRNQLQGGLAKENIPTAMLLFEALNAYGIKYAQDASTPYSQIRGDRSAIDNIQYPIELLQSKMGDCDDLTVLYCSLLENLNIPTAMVDAPDHILMMFDSGVTESHRLGFSLDGDLYLERNGRFWIPVEVTKLGEGSFIEAWELGAKICKSLRKEDMPGSTSVREAWSRYPYALPSHQEEIKPPDSEELERSFVEGMTQLQIMREGYIERKYIEPLLQNPDDHRRRMDLAKTQIESNSFNEAISTLMYLLNTDLKGEAYYYIGFSYAGKTDYEAAVRYVEKALEHDPENRGYENSLEVLKGALTQ